MSAAVTELFTYSTEYQVRTVIVDGEPWFVAADIARILGYSATEAMTRSMDDDEKGMQILHTPGGDQKVTVINEPGLYDAILRSRIAAARDFKRWVKCDVLPQIRRTGFYNQPAAISFEEMTAQVIGGLQERIAVAQARAAELEAPAAAWQSLAAADGDYTVGDAAKVLARDGVETGPRKLYDWMLDRGWVFRRAGSWHAMQSMVNAGLLVERVATYADHGTGERKQADPQVRVTPKGLERLRSELSDQRRLAVVQ